MDLLIASHPVTNAAYKVAMGHKGGEDDVDSTPGGGLTRTSIKKPSSPNLKGSATALATPPHTIPDQAELPASARMVRDHTREKARQATLQKLMKVPPTPALTTNAQMPPMLTHRHQTPAFVDTAYSLRSVERRIKI